MYVSCVCLKIGCLPSRLLRTITYEFWFALAQRRAPSWLSIKTCFVCVMRKRPYFGGGKLITVWIMFPPTAMRSPSIYIMRYHLCPSMRCLSHVPSRMTRSHKRIPNNVTSTKSIKTLYDNSSIHRRSHSYIQKPRRGGVNKKPKSYWMRS